MEFILEDIYPFVILLAQDLISIISANQNDFNKCNSLLISEVL